MKKTLTLKQARKRKGWTLAQLASRAHVAHSTLSRLERGQQRPLYETVVAIRQALGCAVDFGRV